jgi:hypothetical protein
MKLIIYKQSIKNVRVMLRYMIVDMYMRLFMSVRKKVCIYIVSSYVSFLLLHIFLCFNHKKAQENERCNNKMNRNKNFAKIEKLIF